MTTQSILFCERWVNTSYNYCVCVFLLAYLVLSVTWNILVCFHCSFYHYKISFFVLFNYFLRELYFILCQDHYPILFSFSFPEYPCTSFYFFTHGFCDCFHFMYVLLCNRKYKMELDFALLATYKYFFFIGKKRPFIFINKTNLLAWINCPSFWLSLYLFVFIVFFFKIIILISIVDSAFNISYIHTMYNN